MYAMLLSWSLGYFGLRCFLMNSEVLFSYRLTPGRMDDIGFSIGFLMYLSILQVKQCFVVSRVDILHYFKKSHKKSSSFFLLRPDEWILLDQLYRKIQGENIVANFIYYTLRALSGTDYFYLHLSIYAFSLFTLYFLCFY
jgi:hypothetical protein